MLALRLASRMTARRASSRRLSVPSVMKAAVVREPGAADALKVESDFPVPDIAAGQVLVKNAACTSDSAANAVDGGQTKPATPVTRLA